MSDVKPLTRTRRITAERMTLSATTIPQVTYTLRCDVTEALDLRRALKIGPRPRAASSDPPCRSTPRGPRRGAGAGPIPLVNSQWVEAAGIRVLPEVNIAVAVDLGDRGLVIPVVHDAARL